MRVIPLALALYFSLVFSEPFCIKGVENDTREPYLNYALLKTVEKAVLEIGGELRCEGDAKGILIRIKNFKETPIAYTPQQRVSSYNLNLSFEVVVGDRSFSLSGVVPYSLVSGGLGDIPRRRAIDDLLDKIYLDLLQNLRR
ncbi:hypothetical protein BCF55_1458 [Hydrogenivirga caldilitoris]|uniref:Lipopolysaccharide assembly protein n=1 Tax=Hydrogenivirga caldilitoris TaxID=246264 RepID=A0A497XSM5_9AQUI|nr:hypothetical protein [Hydrogenivirga caldilitoris]RLJ71160.1 hypothetical protein BCF55_1458 [Hydrogenivirga caldilitoris]